MDVKHFTDPRAAENLKALYKSSRAIPFFGTGFTRDCTSKNGRVPDANKLAELITRIAAAKEGLDLKKKTEILNIKDLKTAFELISTDRYVDIKSRRALLENLFSKVDLRSTIKSEILNLDWPHILSFNIDDAIERATNTYEPILPNRPVTREFIAAKHCLFKIHGDIDEFIKYEDPNVIFTWRQYAKSLRTNTAMLSFIEQAQHIAFLFIGCSLDGEFDLLHMEASQQFKNSIFLKKGELSVTEELRLENYGIEQVIQFDTYDQIYEWLFDMLKNEECQMPFKDLTFDENLKNSSDGVEVIAHGGPLITEDHSGNRIARNLNIFAKRSYLSEALETLRSQQYLFITGRRFSGKTEFLLQLLNELQHLSFFYYASSDVFSNNLKRLVNGVEGTAFFFDSNYLDVDALDSLLSWNSHHTNRFIICASSGDAEILRYTFQKRNIKITERKIDNYLKDTEIVSFNKELVKYTLPNYDAGETLLNFAYRYYDAYKGTIKKSAIFYDEIDIQNFKILITASAFSKATESLIKSIYPYFSYEDFVKSYDRLFEVEQDGIDGRVLICNSNAWLIATIEAFIKNKTDQAITAVSQIIASLVDNGYLSSSYSLITFNKLNELCGRSGNDRFIRGIYKEVERAFSGNEHYWMQRAKFELVMGASSNSIADGIRFAIPLRVNNQKTKNQTYYSATLLLAQLYSRLYKLDGSIEVLLDLLQYHLDSIGNYSNNKRHVDKVVYKYRDRKSDTRFALDSLDTVTDIKLLPYKKEIQEVLSFFRGKIS